MKISREFIQNVFFLILIVVLGLNMISVFLPFLAVIIIAQVLVEFYKPVNKFINKYLKQESLSSFLTVLFVILTILVPAILLVYATAGEANTMKDDVSKFIENSGLFENDERNISYRINNFLEGIGISEEVDLKSLLTERADDFLNLFIGSIPSLASSFLNILFQIFILVFIMFFTFKEYNKIPKYLNKYSPFDDKIDIMFLKKFRQTSTTVIRGSLIVAIAQATVVVLPMIIFGVKAPTFWWILMAIVSIIPVGAGVVSIPMGIIMIVSPEFTALQGIFLIIYSIVGINLVDSILRPLVTKGGTGLHPLIAFLSAIGGLIAFANPLGLLYGPLIAVFYKSAIEVFQERYKIVDQ